jgi:hypothetical protein
MKIKTSELTGPALDWLVAKCAGDEVFMNADYYDVWTTDGYKPSTLWAQGGPIIELEKIGLEFLAGAGDAGMDVWVASIRGIDECGPTPLIAAMRCYVASKLGDEVEIPEELK